MVRASVCAIRKAGAKSKLRSFLDVNEPELVEMLHRLWNHQGNAITYKELREAILSGEFARNGEVSGEYAEEWLNNWRQEYSQFVQKYMLPEWEKAFAEGLKEIADKRPGWYFNPFENGVREWAMKHGAQFVTNSTQTQLDGLKAIIRRASTGDMHGMSVDKLARVVRPMVGLTWRQGIANVNYYESLVKGGMSEKKALEKAILYGQKQHRYRGYNIARTELAFAYNHGAISGIREAQRIGLMGVMVKRWVTAADERTCSICESLNGASLGLDEGFSYQGKGGERIPINPRLTEPETKEVPPAHPSCRCTVAFDEVSPPSPETMANAASYEKLVDIAPKQNTSGFDVIEEIGWLQSTGRYDIIEEIPRNANAPETYTWENIVNAPEDEIRKFIKSDAQPKTILEGKQGKHIKGHNNYTEGRSYITIPIEEIQRLVEQYAGTGQLAFKDGVTWRRQEVIFVDRIIGIDVNEITRDETSTNGFKIHYSKKGVHIVPYLKRGDAK